MISFRYHVVSIVAVFLALALGIVVGTTALNGPITDDLRKRVDAANTDRSQLQQQLDLAQSQNGDADAFVAQFGPLVVKDALTEKNVLVLTLPGASSSVEGKVSDQIASAGGTVTGTVAMTGDFFSTARAADIKSLVTNGTQPGGLELPTTDDAVSLGSALLAYVLTGKATDTELATTVSAFTSLQMLQVPGSETVKPADRVVVVGTGATSDAATAKAQATFASAFQQAEATVVVAGNAASATNGVLKAIRDDGTLDKTLSTVDNTDAAMGQISTVLALTDGAQVGAYGTGDNADSPYPKLTS